MFAGCSRTDYSFTFFFFWIRVSGCESELRNNCLKEQDIFPSPPRFLVLPTQKRHSSALMFLAAPPSVLSVIRLHLCIRKLRSEVKENEQQLHVRPVDPGLNEASGVWFKCRKLRVWWERNPLMGVMLMVNDTEKTAQGRGVGGGRGGRIGCESFTAPTRQTRPERETSGW